MAAGADAGNPEDRRRQSCRTLHAVRARRSKIPAKTGATPCFTTRPRTGDSRPNLQILSKAKRPCILLQNDDIDFHLRAMQCVPQRCWPGFEQPTSLVS